VTGEDPWQPKFLAVVAVVALLLSASAVVGLVHVQQVRARGDDAAHLVVQVEKEVDDLYGAITPILHASSDPRTSLPSTLLEDARQRGRSLDATLVRLQHHRPSVPVRTAVIQETRTFHTTVADTLDEVAVAGSPAPPDWVTRAHRVLDPLYSRLRKDLAELASTSTIAADAAERQAIWGSAGLVTTLSVLLMVAAWSLAQARAQTAHRTTTATARRFESLISNISDLVTVLNGEGRVAFQSPSLACFLGIEHGGVLTEVIHPDDMAQLDRIVADPAAASGRTLELRLRHGDGNYHWWETRVTDLRDDPSVRGLVLTSRDVTERRKKEGRLAELAYQDPLTGLSNRAALHRHLTARQRQRSSPGGHLFFIDLDDFKAINDTLGHDVGDRVLQVVGERLRGSVRSQELVARLGGDEFAVVVNAAPEEVTRLLADRMMVALSRPIAVGGRDILLTASMGVAPETYPTAPSRSDATGEPTATGEPAEAAQPPTWLTDPLHKADIALYAAKARGKGRWERFDPTMEEHAWPVVELRQALQEAQLRDQFVLHYQPIFDLRTNRVCALEALLRWRRDDVMVGPDRFLDVAEDSGLIVPIGGWVLRRACADLASLHRQLPETVELSVAVNVSGRQLAESTLPDDIRTALRDAPLNAEHLAIEVEESLLCQHPLQAEAMLAEVRRLGVRIALDRFGTGGCTISQLTALPVDTLKLDPSLIRPLSGSEQDVPAIVSAVLGLARALALRTVAEGVETWQQWETLRARHCSHAQGYLLARPMPFTELTDRLAEASDLTLPTPMPGADHRDGPPRINPR
jgi:diguanylate cyclase (GGDEF)-like protein/PAS domain S-box-containing protein